MQKIRGAHPATESRMSPGRTFDIGLSLIRLPRTNGSVCRFAQCFGIRFLGVVNHRINLEDIWRFTLKLGTNLPANLSRQFRSGQRFAEVLLPPEVLLHLHECGQLRQYIWRTPCGFRLAHRWRRAIAITDRHIRGMPPTF
jgi:hypothetical protein